MPNYDKRCNTCGLTQMDVLEPLQAPKVPCVANCGGVMERMWIQGKSHHIVGDEIDVWITNGLCYADGSPRHFRSQKELDKVAAEKGMENHVVHQGGKGSDKSPHTVRWDAMSPVKEADRIKRWYEHEAELLGTHS